MFGPQKNITVKIKLYGGLDQLAKIDHYDPDAGIELQIKQGARLKKVFEKIGLGRRESVVCFVNGKKAGFGEELKNNDVIFFMRPATGG
jgi:molybdopterin converting factor small subunit